VVNWGDGSAAETLAAGAKTATHKYAGAAKYPITVTIADVAGNSAPIAAGAVTAVAQTGTYRLDRSSIWATQSVTLRVSGVNGTSVKVVWGDGHTSTASANMPVSHTYQKAGTYSVKVTPVNAAGAGTTVTAGSVKVVKDAYAPKVTLKVPGSAYRASSWAKITGSATDTGLGVRNVRVKLTEQRGSKWYYYRHGKWTKASSRTSALAKAEVVEATLSGSTWTVRVSGIRTGTLRISYWGVDKAGISSAAKVYFQKITR
jgi:5'-nucleotidase